MSSSRVTHNVAEYGGLILGLGAVLKIIQRPCNMPCNMPCNSKKGVRREALKVVVKGDSMLVLNQVQQNWNCETPGLKPLCSASRSLLLSISSLLESPQNISLLHVPRAENKEADRLANRAMDERAGAVEVDDERALQGEVVQREVAAVKEEEEEEEAEGEKEENRRGEKGAAEGAAEGACWVGLRQVVAASDSRERGKTPPDALEIIDISDDEPSSEKPAARTKRKAGPENLESDGGGGGFFDVRSEHKAAPRRVAKKPRPPVGGGRELHL